MKYNEVKKIMETGDLILFSGQYEMSKLVEKLEECPWSHVAMVVKFDEISEPFLWESTSLTNLKDVLFDDHKKGPKLVELYKRLKSYGNDVTPYKPPIYSFRKLNLKRTSEMLDDLYKLFYNVYGIPNPGELKMIWEVFEGKIFNLPSKKDNYTCSELIAESYIKMGLLGTKKVINSYMPKDFSSYGNISLLKGSFDKEVIIEL
ncbi:hypothetical protein OSSY52_00660 [Tepiditoga spiralis]|uniref:Permuted papain-like amidase YaeF/Yiix C92 family enzyme n=1 Tax=Tepiditoga spiralis TaxID=2108365 RepID=A0A7G1G244_9BACT|nr:hypothetical protein [Tepiditoga spiralis]BBE29925.1 hypothetical protein OSSY52_00660 [Tepiditoga spiralis]